MNAMNNKNPNSYETFSAVSGIFVFFLRICTGTELNDDQRFRKTGHGGFGRILPRGRIDAESVRHGSARRRNVFRRSFRDESAGA